MVRNRTKIDGLPYRVYERLGVRNYNISYKLPNGKWAFSYSCSANDKTEINKLRKKAIVDWASIEYGEIANGPTEKLVNAWFEYQDALPDNDQRKRADSTIKENKREAVNLKKAFGHLDPSEINKTHGYTYLDACAIAGRPIKANKEIALLQLILEYGVRIGRLMVNPLARITKNKTTPQKRFVSDDELELAVRVGKEKGGSRYIVALALKTAWLCVKRSVEVRAIARDAITPEGILWRDGKNKEKPPVLIQWTEELKATITEVLNIKRNHVAGSMYLFGNMRGQRYTKGGWKSILDDLMTECIKQAAKDGVEFTAFNLQDCRPKGVSDKLESGQTDIKNATGHTSDRMIDQYYDRRKVKKARPVK